MIFWSAGSGGVERVGHVSESIELSTKMNSCIGIQDAQTSICETVLEIMTMSKYSQCFDGENQIRLAGVLEKYHTRGDSDVRTRMPRHRFVKEF